MAKDFFAVWAFAVMMAAVLPIAVPYAIWPPGIMTENEWVQTDLTVACEERAKLDAQHYTHPVASLLALSSSVDSCEGATAGPLKYTAAVTAHGPYGIPFASSPRVTSQGGAALKLDGGGAALGFLALVGGVALTSLPFVYVLLRHTLRGGRRVAVESRPTDTPP